MVELTYEEGVIGSLVTERSVERGRGAVVTASELVTASEIELVVLMSPTSCRAKGTMAPRLESTVSV